MSEDDTARALVDSVFGGTDYMGQPYTPGSLCAHTVLAAVDAADRGACTDAVPLLNDYLARAEPPQAGWRNLCATAALLIAETLHTSNTPPNYTVDLDTGRERTQAAALDAINYVSAGDFDAANEVFDGIDSAFGAEGMQRLALDLISLHVHLRRMLRRHHHP